MLFVPHILFDSTYSLFFLVRDEFPELFEDWYKDTQTVTYQKDKQNYKPMLLHNLFPY